jgi:hypothetical protein
MFGESQRPESQRPESQRPLSSVPGARSGRPRHESADMKSFQDGAYAMAALSATVVAFRLLMKKGLLTREEAVRNLLDEAVQRAIFAESLHEATSGRSTAELNRQSAEILKFIAESL